MSVLYLLLIGRMALRKNLCVVFLKVAVAALGLIPHRSLSCCGDTSECLSLLWNVCNVGTLVKPGSMRSLRCWKSLFTLALSVCIPAIRRCAEVRSNIISSFLLPTISWTNANESIVMHNIFQTPYSFRERHIMWIPLVR